MPIDATVGGEDSNSYVTLTASDTYFENHWLLAKQETWLDLTDGQKESALKVAVQIIDSLRLLDKEYTTGSLPAALLVNDGYGVVIHRQLVNQRLVFPRNIDIDSAGDPFIPQEVKDAQCEQAIFMLSVDEGQLATQLSGVVEEAASTGGVRIYQQFGGKGTMLAPMAYELLKKFIRSTSVKLRRS